MKLSSILPKARAIWILTLMVGHILKVKEIEKAAPHIERALDALKKDTSDG